MRQFRLLFFIVSLLFFSLISAKVAYSQVQADDPDFQVVLVKKSKKKNPVIKRSIASEDNRALKIPKKKRLKKQVSDSSSLVIIPVVVPD